MSCMFVCLFSFDLLFAGNENLHFQNYINENILELNGGLLRGTRVLHLMYWFKLKRNSMLV